MEEYAVIRACDVAFAGYQWSLNSTKTKSLLLSATCVHVFRKIYNNIMNSMVRHNLREGFEKLQYFCTILESVHM